MQNKIKYLYVPYGEKEQVKKIGAKWDPHSKMWYTENNNIELLSKWGPIEQLKGEDRDFGGDKLYIDLIPESCWFTNVRYCISDRDWHRLRHYVYNRVDNKCECCGEETSLEAHERWDYDYLKKVQKLVRLVALCKDCHRVTHYGLWSSEGYGDECKNHLKSVSDLDSDECEDHIDEAFDLYEKRSEFEWILDISLITNNGIKIIKPVSKKDRKNIADNYLNDN